MKLPLVYCRLQLSDRLQRSLSCRRRSRAACLTNPSESAPYRSRMRAYIFHMYRRRRLYRRRSCRRRRRSCPTVCSPQICRSRKALQPQALQRRKEAYTVCVSYSHRLLPLYFSCGGSRPPPKFAVISIDIQTYIYYYKAFGKSIVLPYFFAVFHCFEALPRKTLFIEMQSRGC